MSNSQISDTIKKLHDDACSKEELFYTDPDSGLLVQTEYAHKKRGQCCESGCRHCPFGYSKSSIKK